ncbi:MAG: BamA/TamA family outer membrane protein [Rubrivivax sp.]|nr:BamA/TamA family outer membrane protein [Rubrivivax sp.]
MIRWLILLLAALASGCAMLPGLGAPAADGTAPPAPLPVSPVKVTVDAPGDLAELLQRHLDIARLATLVGDDRIAESELARLLAAAPAQAAQLLQTEGFFDPEVTLQRDGDRVRVNVKPGARARIGRFDLELQGELQDRIDKGETQALALAGRLRAGWDLPVGAAFRNGPWNDTKAELLTQLRAAGYASASWIGTAADVDTTTRQVRIFLVADSGPLYRSGPLVVGGLQHHDQSTVQHLAGFAPGTPLSETLLLDFQDRLRLAGLFDAVAVTFEPDPALAGATPVLVRLRESPRQVWTLGVGYSANVGPRASVEHLHRRLFGRPLVARNKLEWAQLRQAWDGEISTHPLERQYRWLLGGAIERLQSDDDIVLSQRLRFGRTQSTPRIDRLVYLEAERASTEYLGAARTLPDATELAISGNFHGVWRRLDNPILPTQGWTLSLQTGLGRAHSTNGASGYFSRLYGRITGYTPLPGGWYGQARLEVGQVFRPDGVAVPDSQQFRAGGDDSVRGYGYRSLGPIVDGAVDSGDALATASIELARPLLRRLPSVWGAVFIDAGRAASSFQGFDPAIGAGIGLRWRSPVGPLKIDWAYGEEVRKARIHFSVGIAF